MHLLKIQFRNILHWLTFDWPVRVDSATLLMTGIGKLKSISECLKGVEVCPSQSIVPSVRYNKSTHFQRVLDKTEVFPEKFSDAALIIINQLPTFPTFILCLTSQRHMYYKNKEIAIIYGEF